MNDEQFDKLSVEELRLHIAKVKKGTMVEVASILVVIVLMIVTYSDASKINLITCSFVVSGGISWLMIRRAYIRMLNYIIKLKVANQSLLGSAQ